MKGKYITKQILLACGSKRRFVKKDIHAQLEETIAERKKILQQWEEVFRSMHPVIGNINDMEKDIHAQLEETIAQYSRMRKGWEKFLSAEQDGNIATQNKKAA